jgi:hypothetical protein
MAEAKSGRGQGEGQKMGQKDLMYRCEIPRENG